MPFNNEPFTARQLAFLELVRKKQVEIRDPDSEVIYEYAYRYEIEHTKEYGAIPVIRFKPNSMAIKEEIMRDLGYEPKVESEDWEKRRHQAAAAFDSTWSKIAFKLVKHLRTVTIINQFFSEKGEVMSELVRLTSKCIDPKKTDAEIHPETPPAPTRSYADELNEVENGK